MNNNLPEFRPARLLRGGHAQTLGGFYLRGAQFPYRANPHTVQLDDGDAIVLHDDCPEGWRPGDRVALLIHGLAGCHQSSYMQRIAGRLCEHGVRTFRMDMRGCGAGAKLARRPTHSGRSDDAVAAAEFIAELCPDSPTALIGFSLGGNLVLNAMGRAGESIIRNIDRAMAVCPPADLAACCRNLHQGRARIYDRHFIWHLTRDVHARRETMPELSALLGNHRPANLWDFDDRVTAPIGGFKDASDYYQQSSPGPRLCEIRIPTMIIAADDDPLVPSNTFAQYSLSPTVRLHITRGGGHLGYVARSSTDPDRRWLDWRIVDWVGG